MKKKKVEANYLNYKPCHNKEFPYQLEEDGNITVLVKNKGIMNRLAQKFLHKPEVSQIHLDGMGRFIWKLMDGNRTIYDIAVRVDEEFGEDAQPLYNRLVAYIKNLEMYQFIQLQKEEEK